MNVVENERELGHPFTGAHDDVQRQDASAQRGQLDDEARAAAELTLDVDVAFVALDDSLHDREPETRAVVLRLGGEERGEDLRKVLLGDAGTVVLDLDDDAYQTRRAARRPEERADDEAPAGRGRRLRSVR